MGMVQHYPALNRPVEPVCSVCIANYNGINLLADCLDSVLAQECNFSIEIIVHDDASTDSSLAFLRERYPQVEVLAGAQNAGFCVSNNRMAAHARGEFILLLNNDAALYPDALSTLLAAAREQAQPGILTLPQFDWITGVLVDRGCLLDPFYNPIPNLDPERISVAMVIGACLWIPRRQWIALGGFPEWMESIGEDLYLCCLARSRGISVSIMATSGFRHRQGASFGGARIDGNTLHSSLRRRRLSERNKTFALFIFTPTLAMWLLLAVHLIVLILEGVVVSLVRMDLRIFTDVYASVPLMLVRHWKTLSRARFRVRESKVATIRTYYAAFSPWPRKVAMLWRYGMPRISR